MLFVCTYVYLFYCCNMVKVQGYESPLHVIYGIHVAFRTNEPQLRQEIAASYMTLT